MYNTSHVIVSYTDYMIIIRDYLDYRDFPNRVIVFKSFQTLAGVSGSTSTSAPDHMFMVKYRMF